ASDAAGALYRRRDDEAARHLFRVAAGLDSRVRGETEILGQVRAAYALGAPGPLLDRLFREALRVGRKRRVQAPLPAGRADPPAPAGALPEALGKADVAVSAPGANQLIIGREEVEAALASRERRPLLLTDLAVPRDVDPEVGSLPYAFLYDVDDLGETIGG